MQQRQAHKKKNIQGLQFTTAQEEEPADWEEITVKCDRQIMQNKEIGEFDSFLQVYK